MRDTHEETTKEELDLFQRHEGRAAPIRPTRSVRLVIVDPGIDINRCVDEAENKTLCSPVDDDINSQIVIVTDDFLCIWPRRGKAGVTKIAAHFGETQKTGTVKKSMGRKENRKEQRT